MSSSIHIAKVNTGSFLHNDRSMKVSYLIDTSEKNECTTSADDAIKTFNEMKLLAEKNYIKRVNQKMQKKTIFLKEAIVNLQEHHTLKDLEPIKAKLESYGFKVLQMSIHRDEGFVNDEQKKEKNYHAHITLFNIDVETGKTVKFGKNYRSELSKLQTFVADTLKMQRGKVSVKSEAKRLNRKVEKASVRLDTHQFKNAMRHKEKAVQEVKLTVQELKSDIELFRKEMSSSKIFKKEDYRELANLKKKIKSKNIQEMYQKFLEMQEQYRTTMNEMKEKHKKDLEQKDYVFKKVVDDLQDVVENVLQKKIENFTKEDVELAKIAKPKVVEKEVIKTVENPINTTLKAENAKLKNTLFKKENELKNKDISLNEMKQENTALKEENSTLKEKLKSAKNALIKIATTLKVKLENFKQVADDVIALFKKPENTLKAQKREKTSKSTNESEKSVSSENMSYEEMAKLANRESEKQEDFGMSR